ncbi:hypothetical protein JB92DRAFT_3084649 [Gautieria morchelliformis]|nr:hypothetical protein JB92DRAFT_3084649 [Gautieria morchelliformis]
MPQARSDETALSHRFHRVRPALKKHTDMISRAAFASLPPLSVPPPPVAFPPQAPRPSLPSPSPLSTPSRPIPRSPYVNISPQRLSRLESDNTSARSLPHALSPVALEDVLNEQDWVGEGLRLLGEHIRPVPVPNAPTSPALQDPAKWFEVVRKLGSGSYAVVYLVREIISTDNNPLSDDHQLAFGDDLELDVPQQPSGPAVTYGREFAIKCLSKANLNRDALEAQLFEATVHQSIPVHPNIVTLHRTLETDSFLLLVLECVPGEDLFYFLEQARDHTDEQAHASPTACPSVTPPTPSLLSSLHPSQLLSPNRLRLIASMFAQMCDAVASCHRVNVFHRDIKPENFIVTDGRIDTADGRKERRVIVKLTDFGLATNEPESADMDCGSAPYMSYECRNNCAPTYSTRAADVWSLGIVLINMLYHHNPWSDTTAGACPSFEFFRAEPVTFFMQRFTGMTREVAEFLATRVFCILDDTVGGEAQRVTAEEFGLWVKNLPAMLSQTSAPAPRSVVTSIPLRLPRVPVARPPDRSRGMLLPLSTNIEGEFELAEPDLPEEEDDVESCSRTTSTAKRRKRGARKGKGAHAAAAPESSTGDLAQDLAVASQVLAREISKTSKGSKSPARSAAPPTPSPAKKASKWKDLLRMSSSDAIALNAPPPVPFLLPGPPQQRPRPAHRERPAPSDTTSATAHNVSSLIMGLNPTSSPPKSEPWGRGRRKEPRARGSSPWRADPKLTLPVVSRGPQFERWGGDASRSSSALVGMEKLGERGSSPNSTRGRATPQSGASSSNWRTSSSASSISGGTTASSAFTRFSNGSVRSVSTVATSVSANSSWRNAQKEPDVTAAAALPLPPGKKQKPPLPSPPANLKIISGVPWELNELPRGCHVRPHEHVFAPPPLRYTMKTQARAQAAAGALDTISERSNASKSSPVYQRAEVSASTSDVGSTDGHSDGPKKVQKGQINALAKMLSALKANRGAH